MAKLSCVLVMPAYNEQECIESVVRSWLKEFDHHFGADCLLLIVNDGSKDRTGDVLDRLAADEPRVRVIHQANGGHGVALLRGYREAALTGANYVFQVDSDDQFLPADFFRHWEERKNSDFVLGFRKVRHDAFHRLVITRILQLVIFFVFQTWIWDANIPYRLIRTNYLSKLLTVLPPAIFAPNIFLAVLAAKEGQNLGNLPVRHEDRKTGVVSIVRWKLIQVCIRSAWELVKFRATLGSKIATVRAETHAAKIG